MRSGEVNPMKVSKPINWLSKGLFQPDKLGNPITAKIVNYEEEQSAKGTNRALSVDHKGIIYRFDVFGEALNVLIDNIGDDSDKWIGRTIRVMLVMKGDKEIKKVEVLPQ